MKPVNVSQQPSVMIRVEYAQTYKHIPVTAFSAGVSESGVELTAFVDEQDYTPGMQHQPNTIYIRRTIETSLSINPMQAKALHQFLEAKIKEYEEIYGNIPSAEEITSKIQLKRATLTSTSTTVASKPDIGIQ